MLIQLLPENVANQIAAGEVVDRPANVVKELVENSLDAGATCIDVSFRAGGNSLIQVTDNGSGMSQEDSMLCFKRHATSKLRCFDDLQSIHSFGFRGEAIPSIVSISKVILQTKTPDAEIGTQVECDDGKNFTQSSCACLPGTSFSISHLFYNVPVRRKFLKSEATESAHIINCVRLYAVAYPKVHFTLKQDERLVFSSPLCENLADRITELWPRRSCKKWLEINETSGECTVSGLLCPPGEGYTSVHEIYLFLNQRPIVCPMLNNVLRDCYRDCLPLKTYPSCFLFIRMPGADFDINVHPTKREVRFKQELKLRQLVAKSVSECLKGVHLQPLGIAHEAVTLPVFKNSSSDWRDWVNPALNSQKNTVQSESCALRVSQENIAEMPSNTMEVDEVGKSSCVESANDKLQFFALWQNRYVLFNEAPYLLVLDGLGAQKRIWYERILMPLKQGMVGSLQDLLLPYIFSLEDLEAASLAEALDYLKLRKICTINQEQSNQFSLVALPQWVSLEQVELFVNHLVETLIQYGQNISLERFFTPFLHKLLRTKMFPPITKVEQVDLLQDQLKLCENGITDPEGKKLWNRISENDLMR